MDDASFRPYKTYAGYAGEVANPCAPVRIIAAGGKPGPGIVRIPEIAPPEGAGRQVRAGAYYAVAAEVRLGAARRGGAQRWNR